MTRRLRVLAAMTAREISSTLSYRGWVALLQVANLTVPVVSLIVWRGAIAAGLEPPVDAEFLTTWFVVVGVVSMLTSSWTAPFLAEAIRTGELASWLVRPGSMHLNTLANNLGEKIVKLALMAPMCALLALTVHEDLRLPADPARWAVFALSLLLAAVITFCLDIVIGAFAFWLDDVDGIVRVTQLLARVLSGAVVPLALFPGVLQGFLDLQLFRFTLAFPIELLLGHTEDAGEGLLLQAAWTVAVAGGAILLWTRGVRAYEGAGA